MEKIINEFKDVFAEDGAIGKCESEYFRIRIKPGSKIPQCRPYRQSPARRAEISRQVKDLLEKGLIRESHSPYASPVTLVLKSDGTYRLCLDYRILNESTVDDSHPIPRVQDIFDRCYKSKRFSKLDVKWCYWHFEVHPDDIEKTAFVTEDGHYEWSRMPFGGKNAPAFCNRNLHKCLEDIQNCEKFFDDINIHGVSWQQHNMCLRRVFEKLRQHKIKLSRDKCVFGAEEIEFLGHVLGNGRIKPQSAKLKAIVEYPQPTNITELQRFLGLANYHRRFINQFAYIAAPLYRLLKKTVPYVWSDEQNTAFCALKEALSSEPVLALFDPNAKCELHTDASGVGIAAILYQNNHPIGYYSRRLSDAETRYSTTELECLAVVNATEYFYVYLDGSEFTLITDHQALKWLLGVKDTRSRLFRWAEKLSRFQFVITHRAGSKMQHVDALSRAPLETALVSASFATQANAISDEDMRHWQQLTDLKPTKQMFLDRDIISIKIRNQIKMVVPQKRVTDVLNRLHDLSGHPGIARTMLKVKQRFYWPSLEYDVNIYVKSCHQCQLVKPALHRTYGPLTPLETPTSTNQLWAMDTIVMGSVAKGTTAKYIQVVIDHHSRYLWAKATKTNTATDAINTLVGIFGEVAKPERILTDNGSNFTSNAFKRFLERNQITHSFTSTYHPQTNGCNEKANDAVAKGLRLARFSN